jgi:uncharacterized protein (TIGR03435 family)
MFLLAAVVACDIALVQAQSAAAQSAPRAESLAFEVASVRPNTGSDLSIPFGPAPPDGISLVNNPLESIIRYAFEVQPFRLVGVPGWASDARFDITAKASRPITDAERRLMMRSLLVERFHLKARFESREQPVYVMTRARPDGTLGPGLRPRPECIRINDCQSGGSAFRGAGRIALKAVTLDQLANGMLSLMLDGVVRNETKTDGAFDVELSWRPDVAGAASDPNDARPGFFTAVEEQLGMKLTAGRRPVDVLVVESLDRPTPD